MRKLTTEELEAARRKNGLYNRKQHLVLGLSWPIESGWRTKMKTGLYSESQISSFIKMRTKTPYTRPRKSKHNPLQKKLKKETKYISYHEQLLHPNWQIIRKFVLDRDKHKCRECGSTRNLNVHHKKYEGKYSAWETNPKYLITLCKDCHELEHRKQEVKEERSLTIDVADILNHVEKLEGDIKNVTKTLNELKSKLKL